MAEPKLERKNNQYYDLLKTRDKASVEIRKHGANFLALQSHIKMLGRYQDISPDPRRGDNRISIPAYFRLDGGINPVNRAALDMLPKYSYLPGPMDMTEVKVNQDKLDEMMRLSEDALTAAPVSKAAEYVVAKSLGFLEPGTKEIFVANRVNSERLMSDKDYDENIFWLGQLVGGITADLGETVMGDVKDVHTAMEEAGYVDFLDYLVDVRSIISERVDVVFSHGANPLTRDHSGS